MVIGQRSLAVDFDDLFTKTGQTKADVRNEMLFELMYSDQGVKKFHVIGFGQVSRNYGQTGRHPSALLADTYECIDGKRIYAFITRNTLRIFTALDTIQIANSSYDCST